MRHLAAILLASIALARPCAAQDGVDPRAFALAGSLGIFEDAVIHFDSSLFDTFNDNGAASRWESVGALWSKPIAAAGNTNLVTRITNKQAGLPGVQFTYKGWLDFGIYNPYTPPATVTIAAVFERIASGQSVPISGGVGGAAPIFWATNGKLLVQWNNGYRYSSNAVSTTGAVCVVMQCPTTNVLDATISVNGANVPLAAPTAFAAGTALSSLSNFARQSPVYPYCIYEIAVWDRIVDAPLCALLNEKWRFMP